MDPKLKEEFLAYVNKSLVDDWDAHVEDQHYTDNYDETIDPEGPDDETNIKCMDNEEHERLKRLLKAVDSILEERRSTST